MNVRKQYMSLLLLLFTLAEGMAQTSDTEWFMTAAGAYRQEKLPKALEALSNIRQPNPGVVHLKARLMLDLQEPDSAIQLLQNMDMPETQWLLALSYAQKEQADQSLEHLRQYLQLNPKRTEAEIKLHKGFASINNNRVWRELWLEDWFSHHEKTIAEVTYLNRREDHFAVIDTLTHKIAAFPEYPDYHYYLSEAYLKIGKSDQALKHINRALALKKTVEQYRLQRAKVYLSLESWDRAITDFFYYLRLHPGDFDVYLDLARAYAGNNDPKRAIRQLDEYLAYLPLDPGGLKLKADIAFQAGDYLTALSTVNLYFEHHEPGADVYKLRGLAYYHANMARYAERDLSQTLDFTPNDAAVYFYRGLSRMQLKNKKGACSDFRRSFQLGYREAYNKLHEHCE